MIRLTRWTSWCSAMAIGLCIIGLNGCAAGGGGGSDDGGDGAGGTQTGDVAVNFDDAAGGSFAVAEDDAGNQYTFRAREESSETIITETNIKFPDGTQVKASLDGEGRPVKLRSSTNENADLNYDGDTARVFYTDAAGDTQNASGLDLGSGMVQAKAKWTDFIKNSPRLQSNSDNLMDLRNGLRRFQEVSDALGDHDDNPMRGTPLEIAAELIVRITTLDGVEEVERDQLGDVDLDVIPAEIADLAGQTYILFEAQGHCVEEAGIQNRLTFDDVGLLLTEFDLNFVFPDFSLGGGDPGFTINYLSGAPLNLTPGDDDLGFEAIVSPVFTGTQLDDQGHVTIERRFLAEIAYEVELFTTTDALTEQLFNAALINGVSDGDILEFDFILLDLAVDVPVTDLIHVRYYRQGSTPPDDRLYRCDDGNGNDGLAGIDCPVDVESFRAFDVGFESRTRGDFGYDWFVVEGFGYVEDPFSAQTTIVPTGDGLLEIGLVVSSVEDGIEVFDYYSCQIVVGEFDESDRGFLECPEVLFVGEEGFFSFTTDDFGTHGRFETDGFGSDGFSSNGFDSDGFDTDGFDVDFDDFDTNGGFGFEWYVVGTHAYEFLFGTRFDTASLVFFEPGRYEVGLVVYDDDGREEHFFCNVEVEHGDRDTDFCEDFGYYDDGICDEGCPRPDPDCEGDEDWCEAIGYYGDGVCDDDCPQPDPDCDDEQDICAELGYYGDGVCDHDCPRFDEDCEEELDECAELDYYGDGTCDEFCLFPDPDCEDECALLGYYDDGICDDFCPLDDFDCVDDGGFDTDGFDTDGFDTDGFDTNGFGTDGVPANLP